jgi:PadR family transcriptional regulator PadR
MSRQAIPDSALELILLRTLAAMGTQHGLGLAKRVLQASAGLLDSNQGTLYPALLRLEQRRWIKSRWGLSDNNRKAKFYELTAYGRRQIRVGYALAGCVERVPAQPRSAMVMLAATLLSPVAEDSTHVRTTQPRILALIDDGKVRSETFRRLVTTLDASDVIVYLEPKMTRHMLGGYLFHDVAGRGEWRYLRIAVDFQGARNRVIALLAHELQHAVEVAQAPEARSAGSLETMFSRLAIPGGCAGTTCYETLAAQEVEYAVGDELRAASRHSKH